MSDKLDLAFYVVEPSGDADEGLSPVIMLHGMMDSSLTWTAFASKIADSTKRKVYCVDSRNHGDSPWSTSGLDLAHGAVEDFFEVLANDLQNFMESHHIKKAILVGHSMGGKTAIRLSVNKPEMVEKLIVEDMTVKKMPFAVNACVSQTLRLLRYSVTLIPPGSDDLTARKTIAGFLAKVLPGDNVPMNKESLQFYLQKIPIKKEGERYVWKTNLDLLEKILMVKGRESDLTGEYPGDALFMYGPASFIDLENHESVTRKFFPKAKLVGIENAGHLIHVTFPEEFLKVVVNFING